MKRILLPAVIFLIFLSSCSVVRKEMLLDDVNFKNGFEVYSLDNTNPGPLGNYTYGTETDVPSWQIAQWWSDHNILDGTKEYPGNGVFKIYDQSKSLTIDTQIGSMISKITVSDYTSGNWPHLLISQTLGTKYVYTDEENLARYNLSSMKGLEFKGSFKLTKEDVNSGVAQYLIFLNIQNLNKSSADFGKLVHFGIPIYDSRYPRDYIPLYEAQDFAVENGNFIYSPSSRDFFDRPFKVNNGIYNINKDFLPAIKTAFQRAQKKGFLKNSTFEDMYLGFIVTGWEFPGTGECEIETSGFGIYSTK